MRVSWNFDAERQIYLEDIVSYAHCLVHSLVSS